MLVFCQLQPPLMEHSSDNSHNFGVPVATLMRLQQPRVNTDIIIQGQEHFPSSIHCPKVPRGAGIRLFLPHVPGSAVKSQ